MGTVWVGGRRLEKLSLYNEGDAELRVDRLELVDAAGEVIDSGKSVSGAGFAAALEATTVAAGEVGLLSIALRPIRRTALATTLRVLYRRSAAAAT